MAETMDPRIAAALDPAWYHMDAIDARPTAEPPKH
jgi:hypothetical protein